MAKQTKDFYTIDEIAGELKINRTSVYPYLKLLGIEKQKFPLDRKLYVAAKDVERIKQYRSSPYTLVANKLESARDYSQGE